MGQGFRPLLVACLVISAVGAQGSVMRVVTPDGSTFLLFPRKGRPVAYWASFVRMGRVHEGPGQAGLAAACVRSSLLGTHSHGSSNAHEEEAALLELDRAEDRLARAQRDGREPEEVDRLRLARDAARKESRRFVEQQSFLRLLARLPAQQPRVTPMVDGTLVELAVPTVRLRQLARLMESRRREPLLRRLGSLVKAALAERHAEVAGRAHDRALALLALEVYPARLALLPPSNQRRIRRSQAKEFYRTCQRPERTFTAIVGSFDAEKLTADLKRVFVQPAPGHGARALPTEPPQDGRASKRIRSTLPRLVLGWRPPAGTSRDLLEITALLLVGDDTFGLMAHLVHEKRLAQSIEATAGFPSMTATGLLMLTATARQPSGFDRLQESVRKHVDDLRRGASVDSAARAIVIWSTRRQRLLDSPSRLAAWLALMAGVGRRVDVLAKPPTTAAVRAKLAGLLAVDSENEVTSDLENR